MTETPDTSDRMATPEPSGLVRAAVEALTTQFFEPLAASELFRDAWLERPPGPMQAYGRAKLVGERTAGACGLVRTVHLAPGWSICLATHHTDFGPDERQLNRIGISPD